MTTNKSPQFLIKPSDAGTWLSCKRRAWLDKHRPVAAEPDAFGQLLSRQGLAHETAVLEQLQSHYSIRKAASFDDTRQLMRQGVPVIYQARLIDEQQRLVGYPDFLIRHESGQYQAADAKLSVRGDKKSIQIQLGCYRRLLATDLPALVFLGDGRSASLGDEVNSHTDEFITDMRRLLDLAQPPTVRYSHSKCRICPHQPLCRPEFEARGDLSLLYGIHGGAADHLAYAGIETIPQLAESTADAIPDVPHLKGNKKKQRAILQARAHLHDEIFKLGQPILPEGAWIHFDIEDNPMAANQSRHVYLWGLLPPPYTPESFDPVWTDDESRDFDGWLGFLQKIEQYRSRFSKIVLAHYSNHEKATIRNYAARYGMTENATVVWLLGDDGPLFDIQKPVLDCLVLPLQGYGLKEICKHPKLVNFQWENTESGSQWSVVQFHRFRNTTDSGDKQRLKTEILSYNRDDVTATRKLELWLRTLFHAP
ncbi:MAG: TM0106 family RecB-like putative nuclease [Nitrosomonas sp.]|nr:MAG: TM0106 family RecB-like putative nuclease [Nitrosomonas sp.]